MTNDERTSPFQICRNRIQRIVESLFEDFDGFVYTTSSDRFGTTRLKFGIITDSESVVPIEDELWRTIRAREWDASNRDRPLRGNELELVLHSLAERGSYSDRGMRPGWRLLDRADKTGTTPSPDEVIFPQNLRRARETRRLPRQPSV